MPFGIALDRQPAARQVGNEDRRDAHEVAQQVALRQVGLAVASGEEHLVEVRDAHLVPGHRPPALALDALERRDLVPDVRDAHGHGGLLRRGRRLCRLHGAFTTDLTGLAPGLHALEGRLSQQPVGRPLRELDPDDEARLHPARPLQPRRRIDRRVRPSEIVERDAQVATRPGIEPAADLAGVNPSIATADGEDQRPEIGVAPLPRQPADDHHLLFLADLQLQPGSAAAARLVAGAAQLRHDALEALRPGRGEEGVTIGLHVAGVANQRVLAQLPAEEALALLERHVEQRSTVEVEQVECLEDDRGRRSRALRAGNAPRPDAGPILQEAEPGPPLLVEGDHLAVHDRLPRVDPRRRPGKVREVARGVLAVAGPQAGVAVPDDRLHPVAVPFHLEQPVGVVERPRREGRAHGRDEVGHRGLDRGGQIDLARRGGRRGIEARRDAVAHLVVRSSRPHAGRMLLGVPAVDREGVALLDQQPLLAIGGASRAAPVGAHDDESPAQPLTAHDELDLPGAKCRPPGRASPPRARNDPSPTR